MRLFSTVSNSIWIRIFFILFIITGFLTFALVCVWYNISLFLVHVSIKHEYNVVAFNFSKLFSWLSNYIVIHKYWILIFIFIIVESEKLLVNDYAVSMINNINKMQVNIIKIVEKKSNSTTLELKVVSNTNQQKKLIFAAEAFESNHLNVNEGG